MKYYVRLALLVCLVLNINMNTYADKLPEEKDPAKNSSPKFTARIAIVEIQSILDNSIAIHSIRKFIDDINKKIQYDSSTKEAELKKEESLLLAERESLSELDFEQKVHIFEQKVSAVQKNTQEKKRRLEHAHAEAIGKVQESTTKIISELAEKYNIDLVIPNTQVLYSRNTLNITPEVISELNKKLHDVNISY